MHKLLNIPTEVTSKKKKKNSPQYAKTHKIFTNTLMQQHIRRSAPPKEKNICTGNEASQAGITA